MRRALGVPATIQHSHHMVDGMGNLDMDPLGRRRGYIPGGSMPPLDDCHWKVVGDLLQRQFQRPEDMCRIHISLGCDAKWWPRRSVEPWGGEVPVDRVKIVHHDGWEVRCLCDGTDIRLKTERSSSLIPLSPLNTID